MLLSYLTEVSSSWLAGGSTTSIGSWTSASGRSGMSPSEMSLTLSRMSSLGRLGDLLAGGSRLLQPLFLALEAGRGGEPRDRRSRDLDGTDSIRLDKIRLD